MCFISPASECCSSWYLYGLDQFHRGKNKSIETQRKITALQLKLKYLSMVLAS